MITPQTSSIAHIPPISIHKTFNNQRPLLLDLVQIEKAGYTQKGKELELLSLSGEEVSFQVKSRRVIRLNERVR